MRFTALISLLFVRLAQSQPTVPPTFSGPTDPATCNPTTSRLFRNTVSGITKFCSAPNVWSEVGGSGGSGTVTEAVIQGAPNQISVTGTCTITTTGTCGIELPDELIAPGTIQAESIATGVSAPACAGGTAGRVCLADGDPPIGEANVSIVYPKVDHFLYVNPHNQGEDRICTVGTGCGAGGNAFITLTDGVTVTWDLPTGANAKLTLGGNRTLNLTGLTDGISGYLRLAQDDTGSRTLTLGTGCVWRLPAGATSITPSTDPKIIDVLQFKYDGTFCLSTFEKDFGESVSDAPVFITSSGIANAIAGAAAVTSPVDTTGGTFAAACVVNFNFDSETTVFVDSKGNSWTALPDPGLGVVNQSNSIIYSNLTSVGAGHTFSATGSYAQISVSIFSGIATMSPVDDSSGSATTTGTTLQPGSITPAMANALLITCSSDGNTTGDKSIDSSFTIDEQEDSAGGSRSGLGMAHLILPSPAATNPTWTYPQSVQKAVSMTAFKAE